MTVIKGSKRTGNFEMCGSVLCVCDAVCAILISATMAELIEKDNHFADAAIQIHYGPF
jgi:hypothetical protein